MILRPYQEVGRDFLAARRHALLADEMRVGKTPQAILAAQKIGAEDILVVCPAIAVEHWKREWRKWWDDSDLPTVQVFSYDKARTNADYLLKQGYDLLIVDECHYVKNPLAQRTKLIYGKGQLAWRSAYTWALSGTPAPKHAGELWPMLRAFGAVGMSYPDFTRRYCTWDWTRTKITGTKEARIPELRDLLAKIMLRRKRKDVAPEMPDIDFQYLTIEPSRHADMPRGYATLSDAELLAAMEGKPVADREDRVVVATAKALPLVENIVFAIENELIPRTVVFGWHIEPLEAVVAGLRQRGLSAEMLNGSTSPKRRVEIQDDFRRGAIQVVVANIQAAGTAIDLSAASHGYFLELDWVPGNNTQAANRLVSMDKQEKVTIDVVSWPGSVDDRMQRVLLRRAAELGKLY